MKEKMKREHECNLDEIEWNSEPKFGEDVSFEGKCPVCGKKYESVYTYSGIWDPEKKEYVFFA